MTRIDPDWLEAINEAMLEFLVIDRANDGTDHFLLECYRDLRPREAALAYGKDYDLCRVHTFWPPLGLMRYS